MLPATIKVPDRITIEQVRAIIYAFEGIPLLDDSNGWEFTYEATDRMVRAREALIMDTLTDYGFKPCQIRAIRFQPHEVTADMWEHNESGRVPIIEVNGEQVPARLTVHLPILYPGQEPQQAWTSRAAFQ